MQFVTRPEKFLQPWTQQFFRNVRTLQGTFCTLAATTISLQKSPFTIMNVMMSSWFGLVMGLVAVGLQDSLVPTHVEYLDRGDTMITKPRQ